MDMVGTPAGQVSGLSHRGGCIQSLGGGKPENPVKNHRSRALTEKKPTSDHEAEPGFEPATTVVGGE